MIRYAVVIKDDPELFGYIDCEGQPSGAMLRAMLEGQATLQLIAGIPDEDWNFYPVH